MKIRFCNILLISIALILLTSITVSALSVNDENNDVFHYKGDSNLNYEYSIDESKPDIDIQSLSLDIVDGKATLTMKLHGNVIKDNSLYLYTASYTSEEVNYILMYSADEEKYATWNSFNSGGSAISITAKDNEIVAIFDTDEVGSTNIELAGTAQESIESSDRNNIEYWVDYAPDESNLLDTNGKDDKSNEVSEKESDSPEDEKSPGFGLILTVSGLLAVANIIMRKKIK